MRESGARQTAQEFCVNDGVPRRQTPAFAVQKGIAFRGFGGPLVLPPLMVPSQQPHGHQMGPDGGPGRNQGKDARQKKASVCSVLCSSVHSFVRPLIHSFIRQKLAEPPPTCQFLCQVPGTRRQARRGPGDRRGAGRPCESVVPACSAGRGRSAACEASGSRPELRCRSEHGGCSSASEATRGRGGKQKENQRILMTRQLKLSRPCGVEAEGERGKFGKQRTN